MGEDNIFWDAVNSNFVETQNTELACFDKKLYFSVGIDNAFGFEPEKDWEDIYKYLITKNI